MNFNYTIINIFVIPMVLMLFNSILRYKENDRRIRIGFLTYTVFLVSDWFIMLIVRWMLRVILKLTINQTSRAYFICSVIVGIVMIILYFFMERLFQFRVCLGEKTEKDFRIGKKGFVIAGILLVLNVLIYVLYVWYSLRYSTSLEAIIFTLNAPLKGAEKIVMSAVLTVGGFLILGIAVIGVLAWTIYKKDCVYFVLKRKEKQKKVKIINTFLCANILFFVGMLVFISTEMKVWDYLKPKAYSTLFEDYYVDPNSVDVSVKGDRKNLILIFMESMETTYMSTDIGGMNSGNYIPNLTLLAEDNLSFSDKDSGYLGGNVSCAQTEYTISATLAATSGEPYKFPVQMEGFAKMGNELCSLGDILHSDGYVQELVMGSDKEFAGNGCWFEQHGESKVIDSNVILSEQDIEEKYLDEWGVCDTCVYDRAKRELLELEEQEEPFALTFYTLDTHATSGIICPNCPSEYDMQLKNVLKCADTQIMDFVSWCKSQDFYQDTVIVIIGDHPRVDKDLVDGVPDGQRTIYNCIINPAIDDLESVRTNHRKFTTMDWFPTILAAMGYEIEGNRLGLGVNLFSNEETLLDRMGLDKLNEEIRKPSHYYEEHFYY